MERNENDMSLMESKFEPVTMLCDILANWWVILLGAITAALLVYVVVSSRYEPEYTTSATFAVTAKTNANVITNLSATYEMAKTVQAIMESNTMNRIICEELEVDSVDAQISTSILGESNLLTLSVTASTSKQAVKIIDVIMDNYEEVSYFALGKGTMVVLSEPKVPVYPNNPLDVWGDMKKAFVYAAIVLVAVFGLMSCFRDTIKQDRDVERKIDAHSLGCIPYERKYKTLKDLLVHKKSALLINSPVAGFSFVESYKKLATKVDYRMRRNDSKAIVVTSVSENEGKSTVAANLAISLAEQSKKVILIEGDLRRPSQFLIFNKKPKSEQEIGEYLKGNTELKNIILSNGNPNLYLILGKNCYSSSTELIHCKAMENLISAVKGIVDYVIIDSPPVGIIGDAEILAKYAGSVLLVTKQNYMLAEDINEAVDSFRGEHTSILGVLLNEVKGLREFVENNYYGRYGNYTRNRGQEL